MSKQYKFDTQRHYQPSRDLNLPTIWWHGGMEWTSLIKEEVCKDLDEPNTDSKSKKPKRTLTGVCLCVSFLSLLSFGLVTEADAIAQALREATRIPVQQTLPTQNP